MEQVAETPDAFALFELPARFALDPAELEQRFFARSKELHPDRFASAPAAQRVAALTRSRALNDAYQVLKRPAARAEYLLARRGLKIGANERLEPAFLHEILELREELAEARVAGQVAKVEELSAAMRRRRAAALEALGPWFSQAEDAPEEQAAALYARIKAALISLRYLDRYLEECEAALDDDRA